MTLQSAAAVLGPDLFIYDELVQQYTEKYKEKKIKQMNIEYDYDTHTAISGVKHQRST